MINGRKGTALLLVGLMIMSGLVAISAPVIADEQTTLNSVTWTGEYQDANMIDHPGVNDNDETIVINEAGTGATDDLLYLGDRDTVLQFRVRPEIANAGPNHTFTVSMSPASTNALISVDSSNNDEDLDFWPVPIGNASWYIVDFQIDIGNMGVVETTYEMICTIRNDNTSATTTFAFWIYVSSAFHNDASDDMGEEAHEFTRASDEYVKDNSTAAADPELEAGDKFKQASLNLTNHADFTMRNPQANLSAPTDDGNDILGADIELVKPNCRIEDDIASGAVVMDSAANNLLWRVNVEERTPPGVTQGTVIFTYERQIDGVYTLIREDVRPIDFAVDFTFADPDVTSSGDGVFSPFTCYATAVAIIDDGTTTRQVDYAAPYAIPSLEQSTYTNRKIIINVTIVNNGNIDMVNVVFAVFPDDWDAAGGYFQNPRFFYHEGGGVSSDGITLTVSSLIVGGTVNFTIEMIVENDIPIGEHRLPILYDGFYYDDSQLGGSTAFRPIGDGDISTQGDNLEILFSVVITDSVIACHVNGAVVTGGSGDKLNLIAETVEVTIMNDEKYGFIDIVVRANFTGSPWYMPVIGMADPWVDANNANPAMPLPGWGALGNITPTFTVDTNPNMTPDRYPFQLEITAVIEQTLEVVTVVIDYTQGAVIDYTGYGPDIYITGFTGDDEIVPGEDFALTLSLENVGDDTLRDVVVLIDADDTTEYDWDFEKDFKDQFNWQGVFENWGGVGVGEAGGVTWENSEFPSDMFYTMESLDVDNIKEIVEINLYADGVYSDPGARIVAIHIIDLAPGASFDVVFDMYADKDMVNGKPYAFPVVITGIDSTGTNYSEARTISVMSSLPGSSYNPVELDWFDAGIKALGLFLFFIIVLAILLFVYNMFKGDPYDEDEDDFDFEDDDEPDFEPTPEPEVIDSAPEPPAAEELVEP